MMKNYALGIDRVKFSLLENIPLKVLNRTIQKRPSTSKSILTTQLQLLQILPHEQILKAEESMLSGTSTVTSTFSKIKRNELNL